MYLKSLALKGFKSFADRSVLSLEPGITAVVGPNGSGKSNISDAVLWVLGERSARNLRGQAMEDIIFAGSAARRAVSVAEVELVLDNSDGTLPVDFDEVSITRRMYRSGESEYLVNGAVVRRLDVLDILHDSGLGTGTHSIISQGSLDSILQSKPEDRRALIEEAAGVLKHKQRKEKAARKIASMDNHLARAGDVTAEVARQLGPLERKAKRAKAYAVASEELGALKLRLAVDDLQQLKVKWDEVLKVEQDLADEIESKRATVDAAEAAVNDLQERMKRESVDAGELARRQRRAAQVSERLDGAEMLVRERRRSAQGYEADMQVSLEDARSRKASAENELVAARAREAEVAAECAAARSKADELGAACNEAVRARNKAQSDFDALERDVRKSDQAAEEAKRKQARLQESLSTGLAHEKLVAARKTEIAGELDRARAEHEASAKAAADAREQLGTLEQEETDAKHATGLRFSEREAAQAALDDARKAAKVLESEIAAVENAQRAARKEDPALAWAVENADDFPGALLPISQLLKAPGDLEMLVERLLQADLAALAVEDPDVARDIARRMADGAVEGELALVMRCDEAARRDWREGAPGSGRAERLVDALSVSDSARSVVDALLGDVAVCDTREEAFAAHAADPAYRYVSRDGVVIWPSGKVRILGALRKDVGEGVLARQRRLEDLNARRDEASADVSRLEGALREADEAYRAAQVVSLKLSEKLANQKGVVSAASAEEERTGRRLSALAKEMEDIDKQMESAKLAVEDIRPQLEETTALIAEHEARVAELTARRDECASTLDPLRREAGKLRNELNEAKLALATLGERETYAKRMVDTRARDVESIERTIRDARVACVVKRAVVERANEVLAIVEDLALGLGKRTRALDDAITASENANASVHADAAAARDGARRAHDEFDAASERMAQARVEKSRLEIQVEAAVDKVVRECATPLDRIGEVEPVEDRAQMEDDVFKLERRIKNMGAINPDAAEEYEALKERYDYLKSQLDDVSAARKSLARIVRVIDRRMKDDFARTYEEVNRNFAEVFSILFPGGKANLVLVDPDDMENTGVEVEAQPRGKRLTKMMLMSGGEKSLTALALLFAVYKTRSTPFYILDEVEAALDDVNLQRLTSYIDDLRASTQLIMITHQRRTMEMADVLFGVSMQADGVTKVISQKLERALEQAG